MRLLKNHKSFIAFTMHDSVVLDFHRRDFALVSDIRDLFERNMFGRFRSNISIGKNFGDMMRIEI